MTIPPPPADGPPLPDLPAAAPPVSVPPSGMEDVAQRTPAPAPRGADGWKPWNAPLALLAWFAITLVLSIVIAIVTAALGYPLEDSPPGVNIAGTFAQDFAMIAAALVFATMAGRPRGVDFGLVRTRVGKAIGGMIAVWVGFLVFSLAWKSLVSLDEPQTLPDELGIQGSTVNLVLTVVIITMLAPICEELLFRGFIFRSLRNWRGFAPAAIITGLIFGAVHIGSSPIGYALPLAAFGFGLCALYQWTGSLYPCIALHAVNNSFALGADQGWGWEILAVAVAAVASSLWLAARLGRTLTRRADAPVGTPAWPAP